MPPRDLARESNRDLLGHCVVGVALAQVVVRATTGTVPVRKVVVAQDVGRAINKRMQQGHGEASPRQL